MDVFGLSQAAVAGIIFLVIIVCFGVLSVILDHHWSNYEVDAKRRRKVRRIYYAGAGAIFLFMLLAFIFLII